MSLELSVDTLADDFASRDSARSSDEQHDLPQLQPLAHDNPFLSAETFNVEDFLLSRSHTSLSDIRTELREYLASLKEELVELINADYEAFISLSTDLQEEGERLEEMKFPSIEMNNTVLEVRAELADVKRSIQDKLDRRSALREEKAQLQLLLKVSDAISRLESMLLIALSSDEFSVEDERVSVRSSHNKNEINMTEDEKGNRAKHLLRIATEYNHLLYLSRKAGECAFVEEMQWRIERIRSTLSSDLEHSLKSILTSFNDETAGTLKAPKSLEQRSNTSDLRDTLRTYDILGLWRDAEDIIQHEVIRSFIKKTIFRGCLSAFTSEQSRPSIDIGKGKAVLLIEDESPLAKLFNQILQFLSATPKLIMDISEQVSSSAAHRLRLQDIENSEDIIEDVGFNFMANVIWVEVSRAITDELGPAVFAVGKLDDFHKNFGIAQRFISSLETLAPSSDSIRRLRSHPSYDAFQRRWQLPVYFQLRWKDIVNTVEAILDSKSISILYKTDQASGMPAFRITQSVKIWESVSQCWSEGVFIPELGPQFWKLTLQLIKRYKSWIEDAQPTLKPIPQNKSPIAEKVSGLGGSRSSTPNPITEAQTNEQAQEDDRLLRLCSVIINDLKEMEYAVCGFHERTITHLLLRPSQDGESKKVTKDALDSSLRSLTQPILPLLSQAEGVLSQRCCEALAPVKTLPGQFRSASQRTTPSKPSAYVALILRPLKSFFGLNTGEIEMKTLKNAYCTTLSTNVVESVASRYSSHISGMRKNEESLKRLRMGRRTGFSLFGGSGGNTDDDANDGRVRSQLILDVEAFSKDAQSLGVNYDDCTALKALNYMVHSSMTESDIT